MAGRWPSARTINGGARTRWIVGESGIYIPSDLGIPVADCLKLHQKFVRWVV